MDSSRSSKDDSNSRDTTKDSMQDDAPIVRPAQHIIHYRFKLERKWRVLSMDEPISRLEDVMKMIEERHIYKPNRKGGQVHKDSDRRDWKLSITLNDAILAPKSFIPRNTQIIVARLADPLPVKTLQPLTRVFRAEQQDISKPQDEIAYIPYMPGSLFTRLLTSDSPQERLLSELVCVLCDQKMYDPMSTLCCGRSFCVECAYSYVATEQKCPCCDTEIGREDLVSNLKLFSILQRIPDEFFQSH